MNIMKKIAFIAMSVLLFLGLGTLDAKAETAKSVTVEAGATAREIQEALDENANGDYELTVNIPTGTYNLDRTLYVYANTTIKADSEAILIKQSGYGAMVEAKIINDKGGYNTNRNITIDGGIWDSTPVMNNSAGTETFRFIHSNNITIINATLCNVPDGSHLIVLAGVQNATISNCKFYGYQNWEKAKTPKEAVQLDIVHSAVQVPTNQAAEVKWDDLPCDNITIKESEFYNFSRGIGSHTAVAGKLHTNITIANNNFHELSDSAIRLYNYADTVVSGNTISNVVEGILAYTYMKDAELDSYFKPLDGTVAALPEDYNITIQNNIIKNVKDASNIWGDGIRVMGKADGKGRELAGVDLIGNTISTTSRYGIFATTAPNLTISGVNKITATSSNGILLELGCNNSSIQKTSISSVIGSGIAVYDSSNVSILNNTVSSKADAIYLLDAASCFVGKSAATGNIVTSSAGNGISLSIHPGYGSTGCTSTQVVGNTVKSAKKNGINAHNSNKIKVNSNTITKAGEDGIDLNGGCNSSSITNNVITTAAGNGISITSGTKGIIQKNTIKSYATSVSRANGIYAYNAGGDSKTKSVISNNTITGKAKAKGKHAIKISNCPYTYIYSNKITNPDGTGIYVMKSKNCMIGKDSKTGNTVTNATEMGIYLTDTCTNTTVQYNKVSGIKQDGVAANKCTLLKIKNNTIVAAGNGISLSGGCTSSTVTSNTITSAGKTGITISSSKSVIVSKNAIKKYGTKAKDAAGIYIFKSGGTSTKKVSKVESNTITGTGSGTTKYGIRVSTSNYTTITSNKIYNIPGTAVYIYMSKYCTVQKCTISKPKKMGIYFTTTCDSGKIVSNTIKNPSNTAIATYKAPKTSITSNKITTSGGLKGINVSSSKKTSIKSNTITGAKKANAIRISSSAGSTSSKNVIKK